jgi:hypothetical protein
MREGDLQKGRLAMAAIYPVYLMANEGRDAL